MGSLIKGKRGNQIREKGTEIKESLGLFVYFSGLHGRPREKS